MVLTRSRRRIATSQETERNSQTPSFHDHHASKVLEERFAIGLHHGGLLTPTMEYDGGNVHYWDKIDPDFMSYFELIHMVKEVGATYTSNHAFYYLVPGVDSKTRLKRVYYDAEVLEMCSVGLRHGLVEVFLIRDVDEKDECECAVDEGELESLSSDSDSTEDNDDSSDESYVPKRKLVSSFSDFVNVSSSTSCESDMGQNALEGSDMEINDAMETTEGYADNMAIVLAKGGTVEDVEEVSDGGCAATCVSVVDDEGRTKGVKPGQDEVPVKLRLDNCDTHTLDEITSLEVITEGLPANTDLLGSSDLVIMENMAENLENPEDQCKLNTEETIDMLIKRTEDENVKEYASGNSEVNEVTGQLDRPKKDAVMEMMKMISGSHDAVSHEKTPLPFDNNDPSVEAFKADTNQDLVDEVETFDGNNASDKTDTTKNLNDENKLEVNPPVEVNLGGSKIKKRMAPQEHSGSLTAKDDQNLPLGDDVPGSKDHVEITEPNVEFERVENSTSLSNKAKRQKVENKGSVELVMEDIKNPEPSKESVLSKRNDSMGMIFMCTSETKMDCYRYQVLGSPAGKKHMVSKIYKGMRVFLFDVELRMMYGIFKASGPGGYNIEPRAFKSRFPSQVRFSVLEDCVPLAEETFKQVLKDNYYTERKFDCQLNSEQVRNLCKLFHETSMKFKCARLCVENQRAAAALSSAWWDRKRVEDSKRGAITSFEVERNRLRAQEVTRDTPVVIFDRFHGRHVYEKEIPTPSNFISASNRSCPVFSLQNIY